MTKRTLDRLEAWRESRAGTVLFYGYLIAVMVVGVLALVAFHRGATSDAKLRHEIVLGQARDDRSCNAIRGAGAFWSREREAVIHLLREPTLTPLERSAYTEVLQGLTTVVGQTSHTPSCGGTS